jgi:hypothetical protein
MNPEYTQALFLQALDEWGKYADNFNKLTAKEQAAFLKYQGYKSMYQLLAHVGVWWEEAEAIIRDTIDKRERPSRKYDFDEFNAASLARFKDTSNTDLMAWYESERQKMAVLVSSLSNEQMKIRRVQSWLNGVVLEHIKEHGVGAPRFLVLDTLQREWDDYRGRFQKLTEEEQKTFLKKQGFNRFRDAAAHIIAWWEDGLEAIDSISEDLTYHHPEKDTDTYNAEAVRIFGKLDEAEVWKKFETTRQSLIELAINLPDPIFNHKEVQEWLKSDVIEHYYEHAV